MGRGSGGGARTMQRSLVTMKLVSYRAANGECRAGVWTDTAIFDAAALLGRDTLDMTGLLKLGPAALDELRGKVAGVDPQSPHAQSAELSRLLAPTPEPPSVRDFYVFEQHVKASRARRGLDMIPEWYQIAVFYFSNPAAIQGP